jgi:hypothetical protein
MGLAAPWALQLQDELADFDLVHEIRKSPVTSGASHLSLENVRHRALPITDLGTKFRPTDRNCKVRSSPNQSAEG